MLALQRKIILASKSPRRSQLLSQAGFQFEIKTKEVQEDFPETMPVEDVAEYLAIKKARASKEVIKEGEILLAADSVVILNNVIYGKPKDRADAQQILKALSGQQHQVITGVCLLSQNKQVSFSGISKVYFKELTTEEIDFYIDTYQPYDKAGAYAIQEWIGLCKIRKIEGTYANIMGLPVDLVFEHLAEF
ncbi:MAG: Maf family protein [Saprospiraceae bacterium]|nr:Maf family protein [Saprospiraceae bacterium]